MPTMDRGPSSGTGNGVDPHEVTDVLAQAIWELKRVKQQLTKPYATRTDVAASIARLEDDIRRQAMAIAQATGVEPSAVLPPPSTPPAAGLSFAPKLPPMPPGPPGGRVDRFLEGHTGPMANPITDSARQYLEERFNIPLAPKQIPPLGAVVRGKTVSAAPGVILPRHIRDDPHGLPPPQVTDLELDKGLLHLVNRGLLPAKADLTPAMCGPTGPYRAGAASMLPHQKQFVRGPVTSALEDALAARQNVKLDLLTPVVRPAEQAKQPTLHVTNVGGSGVMGMPRPPGAQVYYPSGGEAADGGDHQQPGAEILPPESPEARAFETLMDTFSLHEVLIRKGVVLRETPEFESYARSYEPVWGVVEGLLQHLGALCQQYAVPLAVVNGKSLGDLAVQVASAGYQPAMEDLLVCLSNIQEVAALLKQPGRRFLGPGGAEAAAQKIQAHYRGHLCRRKDSRQGQASLRIQHAWRNSRLRKQLRERMRMARLERDMRFAELRDVLEQNWPLYRRNAHVVIHVPNLLPPPVMAADGVTPIARPEPHLIDALLLREAAQLARLCDLSEPLLDLILVLPSPPDADVISYWNKLLEVGGVADPTSRYRIVVPENYARLPGHMTVTAKLMASPRALKRIAAAVHGRLAYIVPGNVQDEEVELAVHLGVPLLGPSPGVCRALSRKSAARELFRSIAANIAPGCAIRSRHAPSPGMGPPQVVQTSSGAQVLTLTPGTASSTPTPLQLPGMGLGGTAASTPLPGAMHPMAPPGTAPDPLTTPLRPGTDYTLGPDGELVVRDPPPPPSSADSPPPSAGQGAGTGPAGPGTAAGPGPGRVPTGQSRFEADEQRVLMVLAETMVRHPEVPKWLFKIDDEIMGHGHAFFDTAAIKGSGEVLTRVLDEATGTGVCSAADSLRLELGLGPGTAPGGPDGSDPFASPLTEIQRVAMFRLYELLFRQLPRRLHLACRDSYPTYRDYISALARRGGVLEGCPHMAVGSPCANLFIDPNGNVTILSTHEKIFCYPYRAVGTTFPQSSVPHRALYDAALAVGKSAYGAGLIGHVMVDFVTLLEPGANAGAGPGGTAGQLRLWLVDLRPGLTPSLIAFQLFDFLAAGAFNPMTGAYLVELDPLNDPDPDSREDASAAAAAALAAAGMDPANLPTPGTSARASPEPSKARTGPGPGSSGPVQQLRYYFVLDQLQHPAVKAMACSKFFYHCWQNGFHFDVDHRQGVIFNLSDRYLTSGALGCMAVGLTPAATYGVMQRVLGFIAGMDVEAAARADWALTVESTTYQDIQALLKFMAEQSASQEREARAGQAAAAVGRAAGL
ncbi:hypothetical protein HYH03_000976 [Edaphochlamys debaryana]|uniref:IQCH-like ATP-grasp domain-containing protein n=1 Tax=Edaphochlamys debaryana TaxID=47281 RepID=A0A836C5E8_9CHLO|nr:hypothetical protein HYH03_000976 [Edaphochlamys debaryana]|eukprot:KAG2501161.1 hypothetical protein HYH03_000976 [Edaphochlamys debaryana]